MILSRPCHTATHPAVTITPEGVDKFHALCPGMCIEVPSRVVTCECECHAAGHQYDPTEAIAREVVLPPAVTVLVGEPGGAEKDHREGRVGPRAAPSGRCEHCGAPTGGRFAPGHDAKLKSDLWKGAAAGSYKDYAELVLRGWVEKTKSDRLEVRVVVEGENFAQQHGYPLVERRNRARQDQDNR